MEWYKENNGQLKTIEVYILLVWIWININYWPLLQKSIAQYHGAQLAHPEVLNIADL